MERCGICLQDLDAGVQTLPCAHRLHASCVRRMRQHGVTEGCPLCKRPCAALRSAAALRAEGERLLEAVHCPEGAARQTELLARAESALEEARAVDPTADVLHQLGVAVALQGRLGRGGELLAAALGERGGGPAQAQCCADAGDFLARACTAFLLLAQGRLPEADAALHALTAHPAAHGAHLSVVCHRLGLARALDRRYTDAAACFAQAIRADPANRDAAEHLSLARAWARAARARARAELPGTGDSPRTPKPVRPSRFQQLARLLRS